MHCELKVVHAWRLWVSNYYFKIETYLNFTCNKNGRCPQQLQLISLDYILLQIMVNYFHGKVKRFMVQFEVFLHLDQPVYQDRSHICVDLRVFI